MRVAVPVFPGSNCDHDALHACGKVEHGTLVHRDVRGRRDEIGLEPSELLDSDLIETAGK